MTINLSIHDYGLVIDSVDCTEAMVSFAGSDAKIDESGLIVFKGELTLGQPVGFEDLDDRISTRWARGKAITLTISDSSLSLVAPPRGGKLRILDTEYDPESNTLTIYHGCVLELLRFKDYQTSTAGQVCLAQTTSRREVINQLLSAAGVPALIDEIPGVFVAPAGQSVSGSYIEEAGKIAASAGYALYTDSAIEQIRAVKIDPSVKNAAIFFSSDTFSQCKRIAGEQPPSEVVVSGKASIVNGRDDLGAEEATITEDFGPFVQISDEGGTTTLTTHSNVLLKRTTYSSNYIRVEKKRVVTTQIEEIAGMVFPEDDRYANSLQLINSQNTTDTYYYEISTPFAAWSNSTNCQQGNLGRLLRRFTETEQLRGVALRDWANSYPSTGPVRPIVTDMIIGERREIIYEYLDPFMSRIPSGQTDPALPTLPEDQEILPPQGNGPRITTRTWKPIGAVCVDECTYSATDPGANPDTLIESERLVQRWREENRGEWHYREQQYKPLVEASSTAADRIRKFYKKRRANTGETGLRAQYAAVLAQLVSTKDELSISNSGQNQPPAADTYPPEYSYSEKTVQGKASLPVGEADDYRPRRKQISFEYLAPDGSSPLSQSLSQSAQALAEVWGKVIFGQSKSTTYTTDLADQWFGYTPLARIDIRERRRKYAYLGDGWSIAISENQCAVGFDGIYLGEKVVPGEPLPDPDAPIVEPDPEDEVVVPLYNIARSLRFPGYGYQGSIVVDAKDDPPALALEFPGYGYEGTIVVTADTSPPSGGSLDWDSLTEVNWNSMTEANWNGAGFVAAGGANWDGSTEALWNGISEAAWNGTIPGAGGGANWDGSTESAWNELTEATWNGG